MANEALSRIFDNLQNGAVYGHDRLSWRCDYPEKSIAGKPMFTTALYKDYLKPIFHWRCYGSSANKATKKDLLWIITQIFGLTPEQFEQSYITRTAFQEKYGREY
ncbi:MAG: hypothetical protein IIZ93_00490 [Acidaminococcaceae bacterium]|nr:hypothetical protein [Acidaminococcaceae bacterium]